ncbi:class I SAM-dependent methyltransferase, partial [bacterium]|nr:class I SAM-dependent methyltransferase [bacterium]
MKKYIPALRFSWLTKVYDPLIAFAMPELKFKKALIEQARVKAKHSVLDFGMGTATLSLLLKKEVPDSFVTGVDVDDKILSIAKRKIEENKAVIVVDIYDGLKLPYENNSFDRVITSLVFHHLDKEQKLNSLKEIYRVLKPAGELHIADWGKASNGFMRLAFYGVQLFDGFRTTKDNINGLLPEYINKAGFKDIKTGKSFNTIFGTLT